MLVGCSRDYRSYEPKEVVATAVALSLSGEASQEASLVLSVVGFSCDFDKNKRVHHCEYGEDEEIRLFWSPFDENVSYFWNKELYGFLGAYYHNPEVTNYYSGSLSLISGDDHDSYITGFFGRLYSWAIMLYGNSIVNWVLGDDGTIPESVERSHGRNLKDQTNKVGAVYDVVQKAVEAVEKEKKEKEEASEENGESPEENEVQEESSSSEAVEEKTGVVTERNNVTGRHSLNHYYYYIDASDAKVDEEDDFMYSVGNLRDSDKNTFWACNYEKGVYLKYTVRGAQEDTVTVYGMTIANGNQKKNSLYKRNSRAKIVSVYLGKIDEANLVGRFSFEDPGLTEDIMYYDIEFDNMYKISETTEFFLTIDEVYEGTNWNDLYLTEAKLLGMPSVD